MKAPQIRPPNPRCPRCGSFPTGGQDFQSGLYERDGRLVRLHAACFTLRCLDPRCRHEEIVYDRSKPDDVWLSSVTT